jgi:hypothetical protein
MSSNYNSDFSFEFIPDSHTRGVLANGYRAVTELELWSWLKDFEPSVSTGFMFSEHPNVIKIGNKMESLPDAPGHSGSSFGFTLRHLQYMAKHGMDEYKKKMTTVRVDQNVQPVENVENVENNE